MPGAARLGDLIGHAPPIPPVTAAAMMAAALGTTGRLLVGSAGLTSGALTGALSATGVATGPEPHAGGGDGVGVGGVVTGKIVGPCSGNVFVNGIPAARALIDMAVCSLHPPVPIPIVSGSSNVFINGMPAARLGDKIFCGAVNLTASGNVFIGGSAGGSGQTVQAGPVMPEDTAAPLVRAAVLAAAAGAVPEITPDLFGPNVLADALARNTALTAGLPMSFQATDQPCHSFETERERRAQEIWPHTAPMDGVVREDPATAYLRRTGYFEPNANTIEAKVGPTIRTAVLAVTPGGPYVLMAEGGHQMGEGIAQVRNGDVVSGGVGIAAGGLTVLGGTAVAGAKPKSPLNGASGANTLVGPQLESPVQRLLYGGRAGEGLPGTAGTPISGRPSISEIENLTAKHDVEFAVTYKMGPGKNGGGGQYYLHSGEGGSVNFPKEADRMLINHSHPGINGAGGARYASDADMAVMEYLKSIGSPQRSSLIIPVDRDVTVRFGLGRDLSGGNGLLYSNPTKSIWIPKKPGQ